MMSIKLFALAVMVVFGNNLYSQVTNTLSLDEKIYGLSKFWSDVNYNFVYMYKIDPSVWNGAYQEAITNVQHVQSDYAYFRELQKLCAVLKDGHTQVYFPESIQQEIMTTNFGEYRIFLGSAEGKVYVVNVNKSKEKEIPIGSEVIKVDGLATGIYQEQFVKPYIATSTQTDLNNKAAYHLLSGLIGQEYTIDFKTPKGEIKQVRLTHAKAADEALAAETVAVPAIFEMKWLENDIAYVAIRTFADAEVVRSFESKLPELQKARSIIIDIRNNSGGSGKNALDIAKYFVQQDTLYGAKNFSRKIIPTDRAIGSFLTPQDTIHGKTEWGISKVDATSYYKAYSGTTFHAFDYNPIVARTVIKLEVPTVLLSNSYTASAAEDFLIYLYNQNHIKRVGEHTNGSTGQPLQIDLPGHTTAWICTKKVTLPNDEEFVGIGIKPDLLVEQQLDDVLYPAKNDSQLDRAIQYLQDANQ
ncbi:S41 family peptidase [Sphingobacterium oryzagri]|uniref:S41 family peptidase n=1 Tax=Sphingobacterium oryzagri TaxID=3025669 RepID=A0ABY7WJB8_9SPHI|nr:S41 family peptidase [Sphingobacterium sp. KACC 22765]WDF68667.1 S41 family peptidase [Sphingobacterium sp. KACC 22765]